MYLSTRTVGDQIDGAAGVTGAGRVADCLIADAVKDDDGGAAEMMNNSMELMVAYSRR